MKKAIIIIPVALLVLIGVFIAGRASGRTEEPEPAETAEPSPEPTPTPTPTPVPTPTPEPETTPMGAVANGVPAVYCTLKTGDTVEIIDEPEEYPEYCLVHYQEVYGLVRRDQLRLEDEEAFEPFTGYACKNAELHSSYFLNDTEPLVLSLNTEVQVLESFEYCCYVEYEGTGGFMAADEISATYIRYSSGGKSSGGSSGGSDGGDISLAAYVADQQGEKKGTATVKLDGAELILALYDFGDEVPVLSVKDGVAEVYLSGLTAKVEARLLLEGKDSLPEAKAGYACDKTELFDNFRLYGEPVTEIKRNTQVEVILELDDSTVISCEGRIYHVVKDGISDTKVATYSGGSSGGGGGAEWTEPKL